MKYAHDITDPADIRRLRSFRVGRSVKVKPEYFNAGRGGSVHSVFPVGNQIVVRVQWVDGGFDLIPIENLELNERGKNVG